MARSIFKRWISSGATDELRPGEKFSRTLRSNVTEFVTVLHVHTDALGIPHVRFNRVIDQPGIGRSIEGERVLSVRAFIEVYPHRV
ncbi:MAG TPA: hypothetical protein VKT70_12890 [Stellaceae bacterium]|nr:hypothetical protein [Stellaceae bacterium]